MRLGLLQIAPKDLIILRGNLSCSYIYLAYF